MKNKFFLGLSVLFILALIAGCNNNQEQTEKGEFILGNFGLTLPKNETSHLVIPIEWTDKSSVTLNSIELIKGDSKPITYEEDGINYEFFGADPLKKTGLYGDENDIGDLKELNGLSIDGEGKIVLKLSTSTVKEDDERRVKINYTVNGEKKEQIIVWKTLEQFTTEQ